MTQILLYRAEDGMVLATDSRGVMFGSEDSDDPQYLEVQKLFPLGDRVIALTGGAGFGIQLCKRFQRYVGQADLRELDEIAEAARGFFPSEVDSFRRKNLSARIRKELHRIYVVLAGHAPDRREEPFPFLILGSEQADDPVHVIETTHIVTIPRQLTMEYRLTQLQPSAELLDRVEGLFESFLSRLAASDDDVGPPYVFVKITAEGVKVRSSG